MGPGSRLARRASPTLRARGTNLLLFLGRWHTLQLGRTGRAVSNGRIHRRPGATDAPRRPPTWPPSTSPTSPLEPKACPRRKEWYLWRYALIRARSSSFSPNLNIGGGNVSTCKLRGPRVRAGHCTPEHPIGDAICQHTVSSSMPGDTKSPVACGGGGGGSWGPASRAAPLSCCCDMRAAVRSASRRRGPQILRNQTPEDLMFGLLAFKPHAHRWSS